MMTEPAKSIRHENSVKDDTLRRFVGYRLKRSFNALRADLTTVLEPFGLRMMTYSVLVLIVDNPRLRPSHLADALAIERPNMVVLLDELEQAGLILRERDPKDRRAHALTATLEGQRLCASAVAADEAHEAALLAGVSQTDRQVFLNILAQIERVGREAQS